MVATALMVRPFVRGHRVFDFRIWRLLVVGGVPLLALTFLNLIYGTLDVPILHAIVGERARRLVRGRTAVGGHPDLHHDRRGRGVLPGVLACTATR